MIQGAKAIFKRELLGYFQTPVAYVFIAIFLMVSGLFSFYFGNLFERGQADLQPFFSWHPWLYLFLIPAVTMRLWAEEQRTGTIELLTTLPVSLYQLVIGKFFAAWVFTAITLLFTTPMWLTINYLGTPDNGVILAGYIGSLFMAGGYLAIGSAISAMTKNQVIAFVISVTVSFVFTMTGFPLVINFFDTFLSQPLVETLSQFSFLTNFMAITKGVLEIRSIFYFLSLILLWLFINTIVLENRKG